MKKRQMLMTPLLMGALVVGGCSQSGDSHAGHDHHDHEGQGHAKKGDDHDDHEGHEGHGHGEKVTYDRTLPGRVKSKRCEHKVPILDCKQCRYEVGAVKIPRTMLKKEGLVKTAKIATAPGGRGPQADRGGCLRRAEGGPRQPSHRGGGPAGLRHHRRQRQGQGAAGGERQPGAGQAAVPLPSGKGEVEAGDPGPRT